MKLPLLCRMHKHLSFARGADEFYLSVGVHLDAMFMSLQATLHYVPNLGVFSVRAA
jgi:hypothetical protein